VCDEGYWTRSCAREIRITARGSGSGAIGPCLSTRYFIMTSPSSEDGELDFDLIVLEVGHPSPADRGTPLKGTQIEGKRTRVPRAIFKGSAVFGDMFSLPQAVGAPVDGSDEGHPLKIEGVSRADFRHFVKAANAQ
jgi:hypothetical protein